MAHSFVHQRNLYLNDHQRDLTFVLTSPPRSASCSLFRLNSTFPRNCLCDHGIILSVSKLLISHSETNTHDVVVVPRAIESICRSDTSSSDEEDDYMNDRDGPWKLVTIIASNHPRN
jgi:hypothetical protein